MPVFIKKYVFFVDNVNRRLGRATMYLIFAMMAILLYSSLSKLFTPSLWTLEIAQFLMVAYYLLGGPYSLQMGDHVRMDLLYGGWSNNTKAWVDGCTAVFLFCYLVILLYGGVSATAYAIEYGERSYSVWRPYMWPIKAIMTFGIFMMLLQATASFLRDIAHIRGEEI